MRLFEKKREKATSDSTNVVVINEKSMVEKALEQLTSLIGKVFFTFVDNKVMEVIVRGFYQTNLWENCGFLRWNVIVVDGRGEEHIVADENIYATLKDCLQYKRFRIPTGKDDWYIKRTNLGEYVYDREYGGHKYWLLRYVWNGRGVERRRTELIKGVGVDKDGIFLDLEFDGATSRKREGEKTESEKSGLFKDEKECLKSGVVTFIDLSGNGTAKPFDEFLNSSTDFSL